MPSRRSRSRGSTRALAWLATGLAAATAPGVARAQVCPRPPGLPVIEVLDFVHSGTTCGQVSGIAAYSGTLDCRIEGFSYANPDVAYEVRLHEGPAVDNQVAFRLTGMTGTTDLVLVLVGQCGDGASCRISSPDFIGPGDETIPARSYDAGTYYLYIDSEATSPAPGCGSYTLQVTGTNPLPDLGLSLEDQPDPVVAGELIEYRMRVGNTGDLEATGAHVLLALPDGTGFHPGIPGCDPRPGNEVRCDLGAVPIGGERTATVTARVAPGRRGTLTATAAVRANEGDPTAANDAAEARTDVRGVADLSLLKTASRDAAIAGEPLGYTLEVRNAGPSNGKDVVITERLPAAVEFVSASPGCALRTGREVRCELGEVEVGANRSRTITVDVPPSATGQLVNSASVAGRPGEDPTPGNDTATLGTGIVRETDYAIVKEARTADGTEVVDEVTAGETMTYRLTVTNRGPSDSSGAEITDRLEAGLSFESSMRCSANGSVVTCPVAALRARESRDVEFVVGVAPSARGHVANQASVAAAAQERDPVAGNNISALLSTAIEVEATLGLEIATTALGWSGQDASPDPEDPVAAGTNLLYTIEATNAGPSDLLDALLVVRLGEGLGYIASPDRCTGPQEGCTGDCPVRCRVGRVPAGDSVDVRVVARVAPDRAPGSEVESHMEVFSEECTQRCSFAMDTETAVERMAELVVRQEDSPDPVVQLAPLVYTLTISNPGPSDVEHVQVVDTLPAEVTDVTLPAEGCVPCTTGGSTCIQCVIPILKADSEFEIPIGMNAPASPSTTTISNMVKVFREGDTQPVECEGNSSCNEERTTVVACDDLVVPCVLFADLAVSQAESVDPVVAGGALRYTLTVTNNGPGASGSVVLEDCLPAGVAFHVAMCDQPLCECTRSPAETCVLSGMQPQPVTCTLPPLGPREQAAVKIEVRVEDSARTEPLVNSASVSAERVDPASANDSSSEETTVRQVASLVLPFFETEASVDGVTTFFGVRNRSGDLVEPVFSGSPAESAECLGDAPEFGPPLASRAFTTFDLHQCIPEAGQRLTGRVEISTTGSERTGDSALSGDYFRLDRPRRMLGGGALVASDPGRVPPELCTAWDVRLLNGGAFAGETEYVFYVPGWGSPGDGPLLGRVYTEAGDFVQPVLVEPAGEEAFRRTAEDLQLHAAAGAVEWELPEGFFGNVSATFRAEGRYAVGVPGFCRRPRPAAGAKLVLPYFEVDCARRTTLFAVRNGGEGAAMLDVDYYDTAGNRLGGEVVTLESRAVKTVNLRDVVVDCDPGRPADPEPVRGFVEVVPASETEGAHLAGDFFLLDKETGSAAGELLLDTGDSRRPPVFCRRWALRLLNGTPAGSTTDYIFHLPAAPAAGDSLVMKAYDPSGELHFSASDIPITARAFVMRSGDLGQQLPSSGSIEWEFVPAAGGAEGNVSALLRTAGGLAVLVPGDCLDYPDELD